MPEPEHTRNPIFPKWLDPFFGVTRDFLIGYGDGDLNKGYNRLQDEAIVNWNKAVDNGRDMPRTSKEYGMEWIPAPHDPATHKENKEEFERKQKAKGNG